MKIVFQKETATTVIFAVGKYCDRKKLWHVSYCPQNVEFRCSCQCMESFGIPCVHVIVVLVFLDMDKLPESLILKKWSMKAKEGVTVVNVGAGGFEDGCYISRVVSMNDS